MKKILALLLLLLLLIIFCVMTKKDSMHITSKPKNQTVIAPVLKQNQAEIDYTIIQKGETYVLSGNFKDTQQQKALQDLFSAKQSQLAIKGTSTNKTLQDKDSLKLTHAILPHFIANYTNGKIRYHDNLLTVSGDVKGYGVKDEMQRLLSNSTIPTQDNTNVLLVEPIEFKIDKMDKALQLSGTFTNKKQMHTITKHLHPSYRTVNLRQNSHRIDKGAIALTQKILPSFIKNYKTGHIQYTHDTLIVEGTVETTQALEEMTQLLSGSKLAVKNLTVIDPEILKREQAAKAAALALQKKAEEEAKRAKLEEARKLAEEEAKALALKEAEKKASEEEAKLAALKAEEEAKRAKLEEERKLAEQQAKRLKNDTETRARATIGKLLKIENIEFEVAKGTLTLKGESTVAKLANILKQYPSIKIEIAGHTDADGSAEFNQKLSQSRVDAVKNRLIKQGVSKQRLTAKGYGESKPLVPNTSDKNKQKNRRVEINIQGE